MKKILFTITIILSICINVSAQTKLRVGYIPETGFIESDRIGHLTGYGYEYMEFLARYGNWKFEYVPCTTWNECNEKLQAGLIDVLPAMPGDYRSLQNVIRTDHVIGRFPMHLVTRDGTTKPSMKIGTIPANAPIPSFAKVAQSEGFSYELVSYPLFYDMEEAFTRGEIDGYISSMTRPNKAKNVAAIFDRQSYRLLVRPDRKDLLAAMNVAMDAMLMDQPNIRNRLNDKYLRSGGFPLILTSPEKEYLKQKKKLKTAIMMYEKPYAYYEGGELRGVIPYILREISRELNIKIEIAETKSPEEALQLIRGGTIDFVADIVCDFSWAENYNMAPTQSFLNLDYVPVSRTDASPNNAGIVACAEDLLYTPNFIFPRYPEERRLLLSDLRECFLAVSEGRADILFAPRSEIPYFIEDTGTYNLEVGAESSFSDSLSLGVYTGADQRLWRILDKEVNHLDIVKIRAAVNDDMNVSSGRLTPRQLIYKHPLKVMAAFLILLLIIATIARYRLKVNQKNIDKVRKIAYTDSGTGLPNLTQLNDELPEFYAKIEDPEEDHLYIVAFSCEKDFGNSSTYSGELRINHIKHMAEELNSLPEIVLTAADEDTDLISVARGKNTSEISRIAREIIRKCAYAETKDARILLHIRAGICEVNPKNFPESIKCAQIARRRAKNDVLIFDSQFSETLEFENQIESKMYDALKNSEFQSLYQVEYDIATGKTIGAEAFIRWQSPELGFLLPNKFLPVFERNGFINSVDHFILEEVCRLQKKRLEEGKELLPIAVNQSKLHFTEEDYLAKVKKIVSKYNLPKNVLKLEFPESAFEGMLQSDNAKRVVNILNNLHKLGLKITLDDFGSGYFSHKFFNLLPVDEIKIDRSLLYSAKNSERMRGILENFVSLGNKLGIDVICAGIETHDQEKLLLKYGCKYGQGFIKADLINAEDFANL